MEQHSKSFGKPGQNIVLDLVIEFLSTEFNKESNTDIVLHHAGMATKVLEYMCTYCLRFQTQTV